MNVIIVIVHLTLLTSMLFPMFTLTGIITISSIIFRTDPRWPQFSYYSLLFPTSYSNWLTAVAIPEIFYLCLTILSVSFLVGFVELVSYYSTIGKDTGKYERKYSRAKQIVQAVFYFIILFLLFLNLFGAMTVLIYCIFGAILNPESYLPLAAGSITFIAFVLMQYARMKLAQKSVRQMVYETIDDQIK